MSSPLFNQMENALADLREQQERIREAQERAEKETTTVSSKDRSISATVDHRQRLTGLKFSGTRYRTMAPAELANKIVELVRQAQDEASQKSITTYSAMAPAGFGSALTEMVNGEFDLDKMFDEAVREADSTSDAADEGEGTDRGK